MAKSRALLEPRGQIADLPAHYVGAESFTGGFNIGFRTGVIQRVGGLLSIWQETSPLLGLPQHVLYAPFQGIGYWLYCDDDQIFVTDGVTHSEITPTAGLQTTPYNAFVSSELNGLAIINNALDAPVFWSGNTVTPCEDLPGWPADTQCYSIRPYKFHLIAMNINGPGGLDDELLLWSDAAAPGQVPQNWTPATDSEAGNNLLGDEVGAIIDGKALRDDFIIYKRHATYIMTYVGGLEVMAFRKLWTGVGLLTRNCVAELNGFHYCLTDGDIMIHDGQTIKSLASDRIRETLFTLMDTNFFENSYVVANATNNEVYFCIPTEGVPEARNAIVYYVDSDTWSVRELPGCPHGAHGIVAGGVDPAAQVDWDDFVGIWQTANRKWNETSLTIGTVNDGLLFAQPASYNGPNVLFLDAAVQVNGETIDSRVDKLSYDFGTPGQVKLVRKVWPRITAPQGTVFTISIGGQLELNDGIFFQSRQFVIGVDDWVDVLVTGKFISFQLETAQDVVWAMTGYEVEYELRSRF